MTRTPEEKEALDAALGMGLRARDAEMTGLALDKGADPDFFVREAAGRNGVDIALYRKALEKGADAGQMLYSGVRHNDMAVVKLAVEQGGAALDLNLTPPDTPRAFALSEWAYNNYDANIFAYLVKKGMDIDMPGTEGYTALLHAVEDMRVSRIDELLALGADPMKKNDRGEFALRQAETLRRGSGNNFDINRNGIVKRMLKNISDVGAEPRPAPASNGFNDVATRETIDVKKPLTLKKKPEEGGAGFKL
ncbi:MAG: hypothetical protein GC185_11045 [Alphaproteobacteria bacterium]|nr:hypothetical protein [Alphaproteobacteria bacterium]